MEETNTSDDVEHHRTETTAPMMLSATTPTNDAATTTTTTTTTTTASTTTAKKELIIESGNCKGFVEVGPHDTLAEVRAMLHEEFDDDMLPTNDGDAARDDFYFCVAGVRLSRKQEPRKRAWDWVGQTVQILARNTTATESSTIQKKRPREEEEMKEQEHNAAVEATAENKSKKQRTLNDTALCHVELSHCHSMLGARTKRDDPRSTDPHLTNTIVQSEQATMPTSRTFVSEKIKQWDENYKKVLNFAKESGHLRLPQANSETRRLSDWLSRQKTRKGLPSYERKQLALLEEYGYKHDSHRVANEEEAWKSSFEELMEHKRSYGHAKVAKADTDKKKLYNWVARQRRLERQGMLPLERRKQLVEIGFEFQRNKPYCKKRYTEEEEKKWDDMYVKMCEYRKQYGHCKVTCNDESNEGLSKWVTVQRSVFGKGLMDEKRRQRLEDLEFSWRLKRSSKTNIASHVSSTTTSVSSRGRACSATCESVDESTNDSV
jgi:hypothetical protein